MVFLGAIKHKPNRGSALLLTNMQHTLRSVPAVTIWLSSGWYTTARKKVLANRLWRRLQAVRSQMMQEPSLLALTHSSSLQQKSATSTGHIEGFSSLD